MNSPILQRVPLGFQWPTLDPFLFCVHHDDAYPRGNDAMGPQASLAGRNIGQDFEGKDGWRMYHGEVVPGFPQHPHRGFETVTIVRRGYIDHSDSLGAAARFGHGDVQWLTAGQGIVHSEMFPLLHKEADNPVELFQIWVNLPAANKMASPHFSMLWANDVPTVTNVDDAGRKTAVTVVAGALDGITPPNPPPHSWASDPGSHFAIWCIRMEPEASWMLPPVSEETARTLYFFEGDSLHVGSETLAKRTGAVLVPDAAIALRAGKTPVECLLLQGKPIAEPVAQHGPFVMNTRQELQQAFQDYQRTRFGGWPWPKDDPVHEREQVRFARHADGRLEHPK